MRNITITLLTGFAILATSVVANASTINGTMTISGDYIATASDNNNLMTVSDIMLSTVQSAGTATVDFGTTINFSTPDGTGNVTATLPPFVPVNRFFTFGGWQLDLKTLTSEADSNANFLHLSGSGIVSGNNYQNTGATWSFSATNTTLYSMTITAVPVPAAIWLFGSGLLGLIGIARRKTA